MAGNGAHCGSFELCQSSGHFCEVTMTQQNIFSALAPSSGGALAPVTMSSREIAELVESNHADVRRSIERLAATVDGKGNPKTPVITLPPLAEVSNSGPGPKTISVYHLCKRDSLIVVAQLCPEFTARIIDRWQELEAAVNNPVTPRVTSPYPPMLIETLAAAVDRGLMSKRSAVARLDALLGVTLPRRAPRAEPTPAQLPLELAAPAPVPTPKPKPAPAPFPKIIIKNAPFGGVEDLKFILSEVGEYVVGGLSEAGEYVVGGEPVLRAAMRARGLIGETGAPTTKGRGLVSRKSNRGYHWRLGELFRFLGAIR